MVPAKRKEIRINPLIVRKLLVLTAVAAIFLLSGCSGTMFMAYPKKINPMIRSLQSGAEINVDQCLVDECRGSDLILYNMERGRVAHIIGKPDASVRDFGFAMERITLQEERAIISAYSMAENTGAILTNDNAISYQGEGYERVLLHHYQALNFLQKKDLEAAGVEVRRANSEQEDALKRFEKEIDEALEKNVSTNSRGIVERAYARLDEEAGRIKNSFQNAYTFYLSGFIYELLNQPGDAYIDYKKALEIYPENRYLQSDVIRLAESLGMSEDLSELKTRFNPEPDGMSGGDGPTGDLMVIFEDGFVPQKQEVKIPLPVPNAGFVSIAFPVYRPSRTNYAPAYLEADGRMLGMTETICDVRALAVKSLKEKVPVMATRQILRAVAKGLSNHAARKELGDLGGLGMTILNHVTENADLRSWLTLPANAQILRTTLPAGVHKIDIRSGGGWAFSDVEIPAGGKALLQVIRAGKHFYVRSTSFPKGV